MIKFITVHVNNEPVYLNLDLINSIKARCDNQTIINVAGIDYYVSETLKEVKELINLALCLS